MKYNLCSLRHGNSKVGFGYVSINANKTRRSVEIPCHFNAALMALVGSTYPATWTTEAIISAPAPVILFTHYWRPDL